MKQGSAIRCMLLFGLWTLAFASAPARAFQESILGGSANEYTISARSFQAIQIAAAELARRDLDIKRYRIQLTAVQGHIVVTFMDAVDADVLPRHYRGNFGKVPAFEVALDPNDLKVVRSNFVR